MKYSIGITTYKYRFKKWFMPLLDQIKKYRPDIEVLVSVNGETTEEYDEEFRREFLEYVSTKSNTFVTMYPTFRGLTKMWNNLLIDSSNHVVLLLNDDISITDESFFPSLEKAMPQSPGIFKVNGSWSHAIFDRRIVDELGWFDERYLGIGEEDGDFEWRVGDRTEGVIIANVSLPGIVNHVDGEGCLEGMKKVNGKYSQFNLDFAFQTKYEESPDGKNYGIMGRSLVCKSPTPPMHRTERFYWDNKDLL